MADTQPDILTARPNTPDDLTEVVHEARHFGTKLVDYGEYHRGLGHPPPSRRMEVVYTGKAIEHHGRDMTVRVGAGASVGLLSSELAKADQYLPLDVEPLMSVGEAIAHNVIGELRPTFGGVRDLLLGLGYIDAKGDAIRVGGQTVKNVAGYDVTRFMVGSMNELGIPVEATFRTHPRPEQVIAVNLHAHDPVRVSNMLPAWIASDARPTRAMLAYEAGEWMLRLAFYGRVAECQHRLAALERMVGHVPHLLVEDIETRSLEMDLAVLNERRRWRRLPSALVQLVLPPATVGKACNALAVWSRKHVAIRMDASVIQGVIFVGDALDAEQARALDRRLLELCREHDGVRAWYRRPEGAIDIAPIAPRQSDWPLLRRVKDALDPDGLLNPGRFIGEEARP